MELEEQVMANKSDFEMEESLYIISEDIQIKIVKEVITLD